MNDRVFYLDAMRGVLMALGVVLHSSQVFNPDKSWFIYSPLSASASTLAVDIIHTFRMPAFFMLSGFLCFFSLRKYSGEKFLKIRTERILIPLITTAITLNLIQAFLLDQSGWRSFDLYEYIHRGLWDSHLWFLNYLILYLVLVYFVSKVIPLLKNEQWQYLGSCIDRLPSGVFFLLPAFTLLLVGLGYLDVGINTVFMGFLPLSTLVFYSQFFAFGILLCWRKHLLYKFTNISPLKTILLLVALAFTDDLLGDQSLIVHKYIYTLVQWLSCALCFYLFKALASRPSKISLFISNASYTIYLFHQVLVVAFALIFIHFGIGGYWGLAGLIFIVLLASILIHVFVISRSNCLSYLFNGKRLTATSKTGISSLEADLNKCLVD